LKIAIISDIHSNLEALLAVGKDMYFNRVEQIFCLGDMVGYAANPCKCLTLFKKMQVKITLKGNHEDAVCNFDSDKSQVKEGMNEAAFSGIKYTRRKLSNSMLNVLRKLPIIKVMPDFGLTLAHGSCAKDHIWKYVETEDDVQEEFSALTTKICVLGHTHVPFVFGSKRGLYEALPDNMVLKQDENFVINVGSVGQPRDGNCRASYGLFDISKTQTIFTLRRVFYDIAKTARAIEKAGLPIVLAERLFQGI